MSCVDSILSDSALIKLSGGRGGIGLRCTDTAVDIFKIKKSDFSTFSRVGLVQKQIISIYTGLYSESAIHGYNRVESDWMAPDWKRYLFRADADWMQ